MHFNYIVQVSAAKVEGKQGIRWHPLFIRWCLNIMLSSPKTYNIIRESGVIHLPSTRTLKDYTIDSRVEGKGLVTLNLHLINTFDPS